MHDMAVTMKRRNPGVNIIVYDAKVQGEDAPSSLVAALKKLMKKLYVMSS